MKFALSARILTKIVDSFSSELMIVYIDYDDQVRLELNVSILSSNN